MSKFGGTLESGADVIILPSKYGPAHAIRQFDGRYVTCRRRAETCKFCAEDGVPLYPPDPFEVAATALRANWGKRWAESHRHPGELADNEVWTAAGLHIVALADDNPADRTVLTSFGSNDIASGAIAAIVAVHNEMIGKPD